MIDWQIALTVLACTAAALFLWWFRDRRVREQRSGMRALYSLSEEIISANSPSDIIRQLLSTLPKISQISVVRLYLHNRQSGTLDRVPSSTDPDPFSLSVDANAGAALCFRRRALVTIPDTRRSPLYDSTAEPDPPRSVMYVPMSAEQETLGVLELDHADDVRQFSQDQQAAAQHLANQIGIAFKLQEQHSVREQLFRSEKLAAAGQLVSEVVNELQDPLNRLAALAEQLVSRSQSGAARRDLDTIASEAKLASEIVTRLVGFSRADRAEAKPVDLNSVLGELIRFRDREWRIRGVHVRNLLAEEPLIVLGAESQLEQVFLNLLVHAEQSLADSPQKTISIGSRPLAQRALVEIGYTAPPNGDADPLVETGESDSSRLGLPVCRGILRSHGGEVRYQSDPATGSRFEVDLPLAPEPTREQAESDHRQRRSAKQLTVLLVEPEPAIERHLITLLSARRHRVVPASGGGEAVDLARRLSFDIALSSMHLPGSNWVDFYERIRNLASNFVLLTEGYNADVSHAFQASDAFVLSKPIDEGEFDRLLSTIEASVSRRTG